LGKKTAVLGTIFIGLSPILLGISTIINPDSLLWVFIPLSILSFLVHRKEDKNAYLYWSGILLGLAILTKYVANILYIFFFLVIFLEYVLNKERYDGSVSAYLKKSLIDYFIIIFFSLLTFLVFLPASWLETSRLFEATIFSQAFQKVWPLFLGLIIFIFLDIYLIKGKLMSNFLNFISKFKKIIIRFFLSIFIFSVLFTAGNVYLKMKWFDFESILASPKSSYLNSEFLGLWGANFYSMIFGIMPLALLVLIFLLVKIIKKPEIGNKNLTALYLVIFILLYYFASTINNVSATVRYQIVTYPLALIIAAIGIIQLINNEKIKKYVPEYLAYFSIIIFSIYALNFMKPFYFSYASSLLPRNYVLNLKDMGDGSYEAAQYLNSLPDLKNLKIWTDKSGVCNFFQGLSCSSSVGNVKDGDYFDYFVVSSGRESRTSKMVLARFNGGNNKITRLDKLYQLEGKDLEWKLEIGERPNNFVKIIKAETLLN
jgi:4-amino-4-deoxy-L-arabinose transferase-like glycosyltransferase